MANTNNPEAWAAQERLRFIERSLYWRGWVKRRDLGEGFGISLAQASADLQRYFEMNPAAARYDTSGKRYRGEPGMRCVLHEPRLEEAMAYFLPGGAEGWSPLPLSPGAGGAPSESSAVARISLPPREASPEAQRAVFLAAQQGLRLRMRYRSLSGTGEALWRWIAPHAFGNDGYRWHARAWCEKNGDYRDFVLGRIAETAWPAEAASRPGPDEDWERWETVRFVPNPDLEEARRQTIEAEFPFEDGVLELRVRASMKRYLFEHLRLPQERGDQRPFLALAADGSQADAPPSSAASVSAD